MDSSRNSLSYEPGLQKYLSDRVFVLVAVSPFDRFYIQMNFAENANWDTSQFVGAPLARELGGLMRGAGLGSQTSAKAPLLGVPSATDQPTVPYLQEFPRV